MHRLLAVTLLAASGFSLTGFSQTYSTRFEGAESPLSEGGRWINNGLNHGDILKASIVGNVITVFINGVEKARATDDTFKTGNPGIGEFLRCDRGRGRGSNPDFGFANFTARALGGTGGK